MDWIGTWIVVAGGCVVAMLALIMLFYEQLMVALAWVLNGLFALGLATAGSALLLGAPYDWAAGEILEESGVPSQVREVDTLLKTLRELPDTVWERIRHPFTDPEEPPAVVPLALRPVPGPLEARVVPTLNGAIATLLRVIAFLCGTLLMILGLYYRSVTDLILQLRTLRRRVDDVEQKLDV